MTTGAVVRVELGARSYDVRVGAGLFSTLGTAVREAAPKAGRVLVVEDEGVPMARRDAAAESLASAGLAVARYALRPTERVKTLATVEAALRAAAAAKLDRDDAVIGLGGGIVGDVAGFVAASYRRGVAIVQCPTTLLAMVDASVGGKTGVNLETGSDDGCDAGGLLKNFVGAFHQPRAVIADVDALASLDPRELRCGLAECVKHGLIADGVGTETGLLDRVAELGPRVLAGDADAAAALIAQNVRVKAAVIAGDEREDAATGGRALLNLGHTFGHAIEPLPSATPNPDDPALAPLRHGEAVSLGLVAACVTASQLGLCDALLADEVRDLLTALGLPVRAGGLPDARTVLAAMGHDKKVRGGVTRLVLPVGRGSCRVVAEPDEAAVVAGITAIGADA